MSTRKPSWTRSVLPADSLADFIDNHRFGLHDDPPGEPLAAGWAGPDGPCQGDGWDHHPLLCAPGDSRRRGAVAVSGEIRDGRGHHPAATFRCYWELGRPRGA